MLEFRLPWPPKELSPNKRLHWARKSKATKAYREACGLLMLAETEASSIQAEGLNLDITFCPPDKRRRDRDNMIASFKAGQDAISDVVGIDDRHFIPTYRVGEPIKGGAVVIRIEEC
jgi:crossover junction endodeoxyribonuclease RusA